MGHSTGASCCVWVGVPGLMGVGSGTPPDVFLCDGELHYCTKVQQGFYSTLWGNPKRFRLG